MSVKWKVAAGAALLGGIAWLPLTSVSLHAAVQWTTPPSLTMPVPAFYYWRDYRTHPAINRWLPVCAAGSGALALAPALLALCMPMRRRLRPARSGEATPEPQRAFSSIHGKARWMTPKEALRLFNADTSDHGGVVLGQLGKSGDAPLLVDPCSDAMGFVVGGTGTGKTFSVVIPTLDPTVGWRTSAVVFDPSCKVSHHTAGMRIAAGQKVVVLGPGKQGINALEWIDPADPEAEMHVETIVEMIGPEKDKKQNDDNPNAMFSIQARNLQECLLADMIWNPEIQRGDEDGETDVTLRRLAGRMSTPEVGMKYLLEDIYQGSDGKPDRASRSLMARRIAGTLMAVHAKTFTGIYAGAQSDIRWLHTATYASLVSDGDFSPDELADGNTTVYVEIPMETLQARPQVGRTVINALMQAIYRRNGRVKGRVLFLLDEMDLLQNMRALEVARDNARKYKITLVPMWQTLGQITDTWGPGGKRSWMGNAAWQWFAGVSDEHTAEELSKRCGTYTGLSQNQNTSSGSSGGAGSSSRNRSAGISEVAVPLIRLEDVMGMPRSERLIFKAGQEHPLRCDGAFWRNRPEMAVRISS